MNFKNFTSTINCTFKSYFQSWLDNIEAFKEINVPLTNFTMANQLKEKILRDFYPFNQKSYRLDLTFALLKNLENQMDEDEFDKMEFNLSPMVKPEELTKEKFLAIVKSLNLTNHVVPRYEQILNDFASWSRVDEIILNVFDHLKARFIFELSEL